MLHRLLCLTVVAASLCACGSSNSPGDDAVSASGESPPRVAVAQSRAGEVYRQQITGAVTGDSIVFQVFEPTQLDVGKTYPLVLHSHGYGGSRQTERTGFIQRLNDAGYYVISIDQRGFGESGGTVRVQSPDFEGQNLIAILDWAEDLEGLRRRSNGEMLVGSYGGSYGGMYQLLAYAIDPRHRLRVLAPDITPHDLTYSLDPNDVVKSGWGLALIAGGDTPIIDLALGGDPLVLVDTAIGIARRQGLRQDPALFEILLTAGLTNEFPQAGSNFMRYHSFRYFCDGEPAGVQDFLLATPDPLHVTPSAPPAADVLLTQGMRDTLFNFNDAVGNYACLKRLGGDVRLLTHQSGHILPLSLGTAGLEDPLDPFYQALTLPGFQDAGGTRSCGSLQLEDVQFAWFEEKLQNKTGAIETALPSGGNVCLSLAEDDAIEVAEVKRGGTEFTIDASTPQLNSALGVLGSVLGNAAREALLATQPLYTVPADGAVLAGIPTLQATLSPVGFGLDECPAPVLQTACDPLLFLAIGHRKAGMERWDIVDDQLTPIRGFGEHMIDMTGIAERLAQNDELALLVYGFHAQYPITWSRDLLVPAATLSGSLQLPLLSRAEIVRDGV